MCVDMSLSPLHKATFVALASKQTHKHSLLAQTEPAAKVQWKVSFPFVSDATLIMRTVVRALFISSRAEEWRHRLMILNLIQASHRLRSRASSLVYYLSSTVQKRVSARCLSPYFGAHRILNQSNQ